MVHLYSRFWETKMADCSRQGVSGLLKMIHRCSVSTSNDLNENKRNLPNHRLR